MAFAPTLDGSPVFGAACNVTAAINPRDTQKNSYAGVNFVESLDLGSRGQTISVEGRLYGVGIGGYSAAVQALKSFHDGNFHTFVDSDGSTYPFTKVESIEPAGRPAPLAGGPGNLVGRRWVTRLFSYT